MVWIHFSVPASFYRQGLSLVCRCFQLTGAWFLAAETPHTGVRPWKQGHRLTEKEMRSIDLPGHLCDPTRARAGHRIDAVPAWYPRGVLRGERPKRVLVSFARSKETPSGKRPRQAGKPEPWVVRRTPPFFCPRDIKTAGETQRISPAGCYFTLKVLGARRNTSASIPTEYTAVTPNTSSANQVGVLLICEAP